MSLLTKLQCQNCSAVLERSDEYQKTIKCKYCGSTYDVSQPTDANSSEQLVPKYELKAVKPDYIDIKKNPDSLEFSRSWRKKGSFILLAMACIWLIVIFNQAAQAWLQGDNAPLLFLLVFLLIGGLLMYKALSEIFNRSTLTVNKQFVSLVTRPITWKGDFKHALKNIKYFEIVPPPGPSLSVSTRVFRLCAITDDDMRLTLLTKIKNPGHAIYLLREVNLLTKKQ